MSLKDALNKRSAAESKQETSKDRMPSLNDPIRSYATHSDQRERHAPARSVERIVTIGESVILKGDISECDKAEIQGQFEGTIKAGSIQISEGGSANGTLECNELSVSGSIEGNVTSSKTLEIKATGKITGEILYEELLVTSGGTICGSMQKNSSKISKLP